MKKYSEDTLVEKPAIELFKKLGYDFLNCFHENFGEDSTLGRETKAEVVLILKLKQALIKINPNQPIEIINQAIEEIIKDRYILSPIYANLEVYNILKDGVKISLKSNEVEEETVYIKVIDFENVENNDFFLTSQFWITGEMYTRRCDLLLFINGLPIVLFELKSTHKKLENAFNTNLKDYKNTVPQLFWFNSFIILSNGIDSKMGSITSSFEYFGDWKKINSEGEEGIISLETIIRGTCEKSKLLDIIENFTLFSNTTTPLVKIVAKNHQFLGVNNAIQSFNQIKENQGKLGVFWHTQGSGKSYSMIFFTQKILRKFEGNYTFVIVTDRKELDEQIYENFACAGAVKDLEVHATSRKHLNQLLQENHRNIFTLIHKFGTETGEPIEIVSTRNDIIVIVDEAHRSQYDMLAQNMRTALPNAAFIAFTGTPLIIGEELTKKTFGDYVSIYNFKQSIEDGATVPLYYENRKPELQIINESFSDELDEILDNAMLDDNQEKKLEREFGKEYHLITREDRLETIAEDIVYHFVNRGYLGKAMVVSIDKVTAVKMFDKVQKHWKNQIDELETKLKTLLDKDEIGIINRKIEFMKKIDMAVVVSGEQNEEEKFSKLGLDIRKHRKRMNLEDLATRFKNADDPFRLVFVCAMWMTGFDVPSLSTIYLDKPMKNHTLMQTIARANRVFKDKPNGLIVDYIGIFRNLQKALAIYATSDGDNDLSPVKPKSELLEELKKLLDEIKIFCNQMNVSLDKGLECTGFEVTKFIRDTVDLVVANEENKKKFILLATNTYKVFKAILPDKSVTEYIKITFLIKKIADDIKSLSENETDISEIISKINGLLDESIASKGYVIEEDVEEYTIDLSQIDFEKLAEKFRKGRKHIQAEKLKTALKRKVEKMVRLNKLRQALYDKLLQLIDEYNSGSINVDIFFDKLMAFTHELKKEEQRNITENLSEEELAIFDLLLKSDITETERKEVKLASKSLLESLEKEKLVLDWRKRQQTRAAVLITIRTVLDNMLPRSYSPKLYQEKCDLLYQHIYENYYGTGKSVYTTV